MVLPLGAGVNPIVDNDFKRCYYPRMERSVEIDAGRIEMQQLSRNTLTGLSGIRRELATKGLDPSKVDKKTPPLTRAIDNLTFINESIAPAISRFQERVQSRIQIASSSLYQFIMGGSLYAGNLEYTGNSLKLSYLIPGDFELNSEMMKGMWKKREFRGHVSKLSKISKDAILKKFEGEVRRYL